MKYKPSLNGDTNSLHILSYMTENQYKTADEKRCRKSTTIFREEATSVCFHVAPLCWSNWDLECWFFRSEENRSSREKPSEQDENKQTQLTYGTGPKSNQDALMGGEHSQPLHHPCSANWPYFPGTGSGCHATTTFQVTGVEQSRDAEQSGIT